MNSDAAHISDRHSGVMSKAAAKQNRTVELDFNYTRPGQHSQVSRRRGRDAVDDGDPSMLAMAINNRLALTFSAISDFWFTFDHGFWYFGY